MDGSTPANPADTQGSRPVPDPTILTTDALRREIAGLKELFTGEFQSTDQKVDDVVVLFDSKLDSLAARTAEQKADTTKALTDALAAQKEAVANQTASSEKSITKSETATTERIKGVEALLGTQAKSTDDKISDLKDRIVAIESARLGGRIERTDHRQASAAVYAAIGFGISLVLGLMTIVGILINKSP